MHLTFNMKEDSKGMAMFLFCVFVYLFDLGKIIRLELDLGSTLFPVAVKNT